MPGLNAEVWGFSRAVDADVKALVELGVQASVIESPISDLKLAALGVDREAMLERIVYAISFAVEQGVTVAFFGVDGTRADPGYFETVYKTAIEAGAHEAVVVDTIGIASPEAVADLVGRTKEWVGAGRSGSLPRSQRLRPGDGRGRSLRCGPARAGSREPSTAWASARAMRTFRRSRSRCAGSTASTRTSASTRPAPSRSELRELSGYELEPFKPLVGDNLFRRESGAVASQFHDPPAIEPYSSELVAAERSIVLGKKSGIDSIRIKAEELGLDLSEDAQRDLLARVKELGTKKRGLVTDEEFRQLARG